MSKTKRAYPKKWFRNPRHKNEEAGLRQLLVDTQLEAWGKHLKGLNRIHKRLTTLPDSYDDLYIASLSEYTNRKKQRNEVQNVNLG